MNEKLKALWVDDDLHAAIRIKAIEHRMSVRAYLKSLIVNHETEQQNTSKTRSPFDGSDGSVPETRLE